MVADIARIDLQIRRGQLPYALKLQFLDVNNTPIDFAGCTGKAQIRDRDSNLIADFAVTFLTDGWVNLTIANTATLPLTRTARYDFWITYSNGDRVPEAEGQVAIIDWVTAA